jgi:hypothetical protein
VSLSGKHNDRSKETRPDPETLIELITSTIAPFAGEDAGGECSLAMTSSDSSFVVSTTQDAHDEIVDLIEKLRRLQDLQVTLRLETIRVAAGETVVFDGIETEPPMEPVDLMASLSSRPAALSDIETKILRRVFESRKSMEIESALKVTLLNGQEARICHPNDDAMAGPEVIYLRPVVAGDRQSVRLTMGVGGKGANARQEETIPATVENGGSLLVDITDKAVRRGSAPRKEKLSDSGERILLLVTPQIFIIEDVPVRPPPP